MSILNPSGYVASSIQIGDVVKLKSGGSKWTVIRQNPQIAELFDIAREDDKGAGVLQAVHPSALDKV